MPRPPTRLAPGASEALAQALKAVRRRRGLRPGQAAAAMGLPLRSYEHFEAGRGRPNLERILQFARVTDCDPFGLLAAVLLQQPGLAADTADNKLLLIFHLALQDFAAAGTHDLAAADPRSLIAAFTQLFRDLGQRLDADSALLDEWLGSTGRPPPPPPDDPAEPEDA